MPKLPTDYSKTIIYKIIKNDDFNNENIYVGSTTDFIRRKNRHKSNCNNENCEHYNLKVYKTIRENGGMSEWSMFEIEKYPCNDKREAEARERYWFEFYKAKLNSMTMFTTPEERKEKQKKYKLENADKLSEKNKKYYLKNSKKAKQYSKQYYNDNADKMKQQKNKKINCECGSIISKSSKSRHAKTQKHINFISSQQEVAVP